MSRPKYPCTRADLVKLPNNYTTAQSWDATQIHSNTALDVAIAQIVRGVLNVGNLASLSTTDKSSIVAAVNEALAAIITDYDDLSDKPIVKTEDNGFKIVAHGSRNNNTASAQNAFAEGSKTVAGGIGSHAEGGSTQALGIKSHAEGNACVAQGFYAHAEGNATVAYGDSSHAEGLTGSLQPYVTRAYTANDSAIYINAPIPSGSVIYDTDDSLKRVQSCTYQENEGDYKVLFVGINQDLAVDAIIYVDYCAYGEGSHIEGSHTHAAGDYSHAEGYYTMTTNTAEHASGKYNKSTPNVTLFSVGIGADEENRANAYEVTTDGKMYVKGVGNYDGTNATATGVKALGESGWASGSISYNDLTDKPIVKTANNGYTIGTYANATATDAIGLGAGQAIGSYSLAEGMGSVALAQSSHAEGVSVAAGAASHAEGYTTYSWAQNAHTEGYNTVSMRFHAHAEGSNVLASGLAAHAEGLGFADDNKITPAKRFHLIVYNDRIEFKNDEGISIHDIMYQPVLMLDSDSEQAAPEMPLEVIGYNSVTNVVLLRSHSMYMEGAYALLQNYKSEEGTTITCAILKSGAQGHFSHVEGNNTRALDDGAHAEGIKTKALGLGSHAEGNNSDERLEVIVADDTVMSNSSSQDTTVTLNIPAGSAPDSANFNNVAASIAIARISYLKNNDTNHIFLRVKGAGMDAETRTDYIVLAYSEETSGCTIPAGSTIDIYYSGALGAAAHVEGYNTAAAGEASHAEGYYTQTTNASEHAEGTYNLSTPNKTLSSLGIGSGSGQTPRMNAYEVDLQGNVYIKGIGDYDGTNITGTGVKSVQTVIAELAQQITTLQGGGNNS